MQRTSHLTQQNPLSSAVITLWKTSTKGEVYKFFKHKVRRLKSYIAIYHSETIKGKGSVPAFLFINIGKLNIQSIRVAEDFKKPFGKLTTMIKH